jgi:hypothetical protein
MRRVAFILGSIAVLGVAAAWPTPSPAKVTSTFAGKVTHVSVNNLKVQSLTGEELSFQIVPSFKNIWSADGKTRYQMADLKPGSKVQVIYDTTPIGVRHADKIILLHK